MNAESDLCYPFCTLYLSSVVKSQYIDSVLSPLDTSIACVLMTVFRFHEVFVTFFWLHFPFVARLFLRSVLRCKYLCVCFFKGDFFLFFFLIVSKHVQVVSITYKAIDIVHKGWRAEQAVLLNYQRRIKHSNYNINNKESRYFEAAAVVRDS